MRSFRYGTLAPMKSSVIAAAWVSCTLASFGQPSAEATDRMVKTLETYFIPKVSFEQTSLEEAIDFLRFSTIGGSEDSRPKGIAYVIRRPRAQPDGRTDGLGLQPGAEGKTPITLHAENRPLGEILKEIARQAKLDIHVNAAGVKFYSSGVVPEEEKDQPLRLYYRYTKH